MGLTWPWWFPKDATYEDFFHFLPRRRIGFPFEMGSAEIRLEIKNTERLLKTAEREQEEANRHDPPSSCAFRVRHAFDGAKGLGAPDLALGAQQRQ